jgi:phosphoserine phosphatase
MLNRENSSPSMTKLAKKLTELDYALFDFDGPLYPGLFISDLTLEVFKDDLEKYKNKLKELQIVEKIYNEGDFKKAYTKFLEILSGESRIIFKRYAEKLIEKTYPYVDKTVKKLQEKYGLESYLISLTPDFVGEVIQKRFGFKRVITVRCGYDDNTIEKRMTGVSIDKIDMPQVMKEKMFNKLGINNQRSKNFIYFFDSMEDRLVAEEATIRVGVNPNIDVMNTLKIDYLIQNKINPLKIFYDSI